MQSSPHPAAKPSTWPLALALAAAGVVLFGLFFQAAFYGDAPLQLLAYRAGEPTGHRLHFLLTELLGSAGLSPLTAIRAATFIPAGLSLGVLFAALVRGGASRPGALVGTLFFALTPSALFFATTIEVHGLQLFGVALASFAAVAIALPTPRSGLLGLFGWSLLAIVALGATHPMNLQAGPGLAVLFWVGLRSRGANARITWAVAGAAGLAVVGVAAIVSYGYLDRQGWSVGVLLDAFKWRFDLTAPNSDLPAPLANGLNTVVKPAAYLLATGALGLLAMTLCPRAARHERGLGAGLWVWAVVPALILMGPDFTEHGAYFLVALPALAMGTAHLATRSRVLAGLLAVALLAQAQLAVRAIRAWDKPAPAEAEAWLEGLAAVSRGRGILLAEDAQQQDWARRYLGMTTDNLRLFLPLPQPELEAFARQYAAFAERNAERGEPLFVPARVVDLAPEIPPLGLAVQILREKLEFSPVAASGFRGYRGQ
jgi:hypothetical protein